MLAQTDGIESEKAATICGPSEVGLTYMTALPGVANEHVKLLCEFEARSLFKTDIIKYIKIIFAGGVFQPLLFDPRARGCSGPGAHVPIC